MNPPRYLSSTTAKRIAWALVIASAAVLPVRAFVTPHQSQSAAVFALCAFLGALLISLFQPQASRKRWLPTFFAFGLYLVHGSFTCL